MLLSLIAKQDYGNKNKYSYLNSSSVDNRWTNMVTYYDDGLLLYLYINNTLQFIVECNGNIL